MHDQIDYIFEFRFRDNVWDTIIFDDYKSKGINANPVTKFYRIR